MARPTADTVQITFRIPNAWLAEADDLATFLSRPGMPASRTDTLRAAIARGLASIREEADAADDEKKATKPRTKR